MASQFALYVKKPGDDTVFGVSPTGQFVAMESWQDLLNSNGGVAPQIQQRGAELQIPSGTVTSSGKPYVAAGQAPAPTQAPAPQQQQQQQQQSTSVTGNAVLDATLQAADQAIQEQTAAGYMFNPNTEITPELAKQFLDMATTKVEPYYQSQIQSIRGDIDRSLGNLQKQYDLSKRNAEAQFKQDLSAKRESLAGAGLAQSGFRGQQEQQLAEGTNRTMEGLGLNTENQVGDLLSSANKTIGSGNLTGLTVPNLSQYQANTLGTGNLTPARSLDFSMPTNNTMGTLEYSQAGDIRNIYNLLRQNKVTQSTLNF